MNNILKNYVTVDINNENMLNINSLNFSETIQEIIDNNNNQEEVNDLKD